MNYEIKDFWVGIHFVISSIKWAGITFILCFLLLPLILLSFMNSEELVSEIALYSSVGIPGFILILIPIIYWINAHPLAIKNNNLRIPAIDIENSFFDLLTLKRIRGLYYWINKPIEQLIDVKYDYRRDTNLGPSHWNINLTFGDGTNYQLSFSNKQKRDAAVSILRKLRNKIKKAHFGGDISF